MRRALLSLVLIGLTGCATSAPAGRPPAKRVIYWTPHVYLPVTVENEHCMFIDKAGHKVECGSEAMLGMYLSPLRDLESLKEEFLRCERN